MIVYLDSSVLARAYLADEVGHDRVVELLTAPSVGRITGTWTRIEASGALVRAGRARRVETAGLLALLDRDLSPDGRVAVVAEPQEEVERDALDLVRRYALRAMDAWHLAVARLALPALAEPGEEQAFATRDQQQAAAAAELGFTVV